MQTFLYYLSFLITHKKQFCQKNLLMKGINVFTWIQNDLNFISSYQIEPFAEVTASIEAYISAHILRAGANGDGTLIRIGLPLTLSYCECEWCLRLSSRLTALKLSADIFYQWRKWSWSKWKFYWGKRKTIYKFGKWSAIKKNWKLLEQCT